MSKSKEDGASHPANNKGGLAAAAPADNDDRTAVPTTMQRRFKDMGVVARGRIGDLRTNGGREVGRASLGAGTDRTASENEIDQDGAHDDRVEKEKKIVKNKETAPGGDPRLALTAGIWFNEREDLGGVEKRLTMTKKGEQVGVEESRGVGVARGRANKSISDKYPNEHFLNKSS